MISCFPFARINRILNQSNSVVFKTVHYLNCIIFRRVITNDEFKVGKILHEY